MNKVWKKKWKEQLHNGAENLGGSGSSVPVVPSALSGTKRRASSDSSLTPPLKKLKADVPALDGGSSGIVEPDVASCSSNEVVLVYDKTPEDTTELFRRILSLDTSETLFQRQFSEARQVGAEVGKCAADLVWRRAMKTIDADVSLYPEEEDDDGPLEMLNKTKAKIRDTISNWAFNMPNLDPNSRGFNVTPKFLRLVHILKSCEPCGEDFRGIIFVKRRAIALAISDLIPMLGEQVGFIRAHTMSGQGSLLVNDKQQQDIFRKFKMGIHNLLIATKSAEDLDLPKATIVIRFDLFDGDVSYACLRSITFGGTGHLIHMVERGSDSHRQNLLASTTRLRHPDMIRWANILRCSPSSAAPPLPLLSPAYPELSDSDEEQYLEPSIKDPVAGGRIYVQDATTVVYTFASTASMASFPSPIFDFKSQSSAPTASSMYTCTVLLPGTPAHSVSGEPCSSMAHAKRSACYNVCTKLAESGFLNPEAFVLPPRSSSRSESAHKMQEPTSVPYVGVQVYPRNVPLFWTNPTGAATSLFPTIITVNATSQPPHAPLLLLTRQPLPTFPSFRLFFSGTPVTIQTYRGAPFSIDTGKLLTLHMFTLRLCRAVVNKPFNCPLEDMPYFLCSLSPTWTPPHNIGRWELSNVADHVPWDSVARGALSWCTPLKYGRSEDVAEDIEDAVIQDRSTELTRRYDVLRVRPDLSPLSHPEDSPREAEYSSLLEYCKRVRTNFEGLKDEGQAIIEISSILSGVSRLDPSSRPPALTGPPPPRYLIPELCFKFTIPASTFRTGLIFPSIIRRLDSFLLVKELNARFFNHRISETLLDMAVTAPSTRMEYDYERLELLGDSFLKYLASIYVFVNEPSNKEGALHIARQHIVSNSTLFHSCDSVGLPSYIQAKSFSAKSWQPTNFRTSEENPAKVESQRDRKKNEQRLGDKVVADVAEAIIGDCALMAAKAMNIPFPNVERWSDFGRKLLIPPPTEGIIEHNFKHPHILAQALTHASVSGFERVSYERLEFLGDAILEFLVIRYIYERDQKLTPGGLTLLKGAMVSNSALAAVCVSSGLYKHLLLATRLTASVTDYVEKLRVKQAEEYQLAQLEKRSPGQYWQEMEPPKVLSDVVESVIGAIYAFFDSVLKPFYNKHITLKTVAHHPTKILFEAHPSSQMSKVPASEREKGIQVDLTLAPRSLSNPLSVGTRQTRPGCALDALEGDADFLRICDCPKHAEVKAREVDEILSGLGGNGDGQWYATGGAQDEQSEMQASLRVKVKRWYRFRANPAISADRLTGPGRLQASSSTRAAA
ncbi:hypothetical protein DFH06DRAFT_1183971 [Mycena polygramma]|nr:hypothetical protein DFH06DRAFT_1183971 [Mycena polygramma]